MLDRLQQCHDLEILFLFILFAFNKNSSHMMFVALVASATAAALAPGPAAPAYSSTFVVHTVEVDDTLGVNSIYQVTDVV